MIATTITRFHHWNRVWVRPTVHRFDARPFRGMLLLLLLLLVTYGRPLVCMLYCAIHHGMPHGEHSGMLVSHGLAAMQHAPTPDGDVPFNTSLVTPASYETICTSFETLPSALTEGTVLPLVLLLSFVGVHIARERLTILLLSLHHPPPLQPPRSIAPQH